MDVHVVIMDSEHYFCLNTNGGYFLMAEQTGNIGFEETLWKAADKLRGSMDASVYQYVFLGLLL